MGRLPLALLCVIPLAIGCSRQPCDGDPDGPTVRVDVSLATCNFTPVAAIDLSSVSVSKGSPVMLDGTGSVDENQDALTFTWAIDESPAGSQAALDALTGPRVMFQSDVGGDYVVSLRVNDGELTSAPATRVVRVINEVPVANAGADFTSPVGSVASLDGTASTDADGEPLVYTWTLVERPTGSAAALTDSTSATPSFTVDVFGVYGVSLVVSDGEDSSEPDVVRVGGGITGVPPVANAGADLRAVTGQSVNADGMGSVDPDGDALTYRWRIVDEPAPAAAVLLNETSTVAILIAQEVGPHTLELVVNDGFYDSPPDTVAVDVALGLGAAGALCDVAGCGMGLLCFEGTCVGGGRLRFSLAWTVVSDFDLHVFTPDGTEIYFGNATAAGGELDVDDCVGNGCRDPQSHVENIVFVNQPQSGRYLVWVENYNGGGAGSFMVDVKGAVVSSFSGNLPAVAGATSMRFSVLVP